MDSLPYRQKRKKLELCPDCEDEVPTLVSWQDKDNKPHKTCEACREKGAKERARYNTEAREAFRHEAERTMDSERDAKKEAASKPREGRIELGLHVETVDVKDGKDVFKQQFMTKVSGVNAGTVKPKAQKWLWHNRVPAGAITWGVGKPGNAKSLWATDLAARVSSGADFPDGAKNPHGPRKVLMYAGEDNLRCLWEALY